MVKPYGQTIRPLWSNHAYALMVKPCMPLWVSSPGRRDPWPCRSAASEPARARIRDESSGRVRGGTGGGRRLGLCRCAGAAAGGQSAVRGSVLPTGSRTTRGGPDVCEGRGAAAGDGYLRKQPRNQLPESLSRLWRLHRPVVYREACCQKASTAARLQKETCPHPMHHHTPDPAATAHPITDGPSSRAEHGRSECARPRGCGRPPSARPRGPSARGRADPSARGRADRASAASTRVSIRTRGRADDGAVQDGSCTDSRRPIEGIEARESLVESRPAGEGER